MAKFGVATCLNRGLILWRSSSRMASLLQRDSTRLLLKLLRMFQHAAAALGTHSPRRTLMQYLMKVRIARHYLRRGLNLWLTSRRGASSLQVTTLEQPKCGNDIYL